MEGVRRRDPHALGELFEAYFDRLYSLAYRLLGEHSLAEDALQEVFLKVHRAAPSLDPARDPGPWLTVVTRNACREHWRRKGRRIEMQAKPPDGGPDLGDTLPSREEGPERDTLRAERERAVAGALMRLSAKLREVVVLHDFQGLTHREIASLVGSGSAAIRKRYSRALSKLRRYLEGVIE